MNVGNARADQRRSRRFRQQVEVDVIDRLGTRRGRAIDVARHGLFVAVVDPPHNRHLVQLVLHLPDGPLQAAATVSRTLPGQGVGLSLFALSSDAKRRWDAFIIRAQQAVESAPAPAAPGAHPSQPTTPALSSGAVPVHGPDMPSFVVKLKTMERLRDYMQTHVAVGGTVLFTPVLPIAGTLLQLLVVHPVSEAEFALLGRVYRAVATPPKRLEILFERTDMVAFARFVDSGLPPTPVAHLPQPAAPTVTAPTVTAPTVTAPTVTAPTPKASPPVEQELDFEISDDDEEMEDDPIEWDLHTSDLPVILGKSTSTAPKPATTPPKPADDGPHAPITSFEGEDVSFTRPGGRPDLDLPSDELLIDDTVVATDPGFRPVSLRLSCETFGCPSEPYTIELGPCSGIVGLVADQVPYWSSETDRVVSVPRLMPAEVRRARFNHYVERGGQMDDVVSLATFLAAADLAEAPRHPVTGEHLRSSRAIERLGAAARHAIDEDTQTATRIRCPQCAAGHLVVERA